MKSIQDVFTGGFPYARKLLVQKCRPDDHNLDAFKKSYSESWQDTKEPYDLFGLALEIGSREREIWVGVLKEIVPSEIYPGRFRFYVDKFRKIGIHDRTQVDDASFYGNGGGGGSRVKVVNNEFNGDENEIDSYPVGAMERRYQWVRINHNVFRDRVWKKWGGKCAVFDAGCNGLLIASHIYPWSLSSPTHRVDVDNGLLLSIPLDSLFDRGLISFSDSGAILRSENLDNKTLNHFGFCGNALSTVSIKSELITEGMRTYLEMHRDYYGF